MLRNHLKGSKQIKSLHLITGRCQGDPDLHAFQSRTRTFLFEGLTVFCHLFEGPIKSASASF